MVLYIGEYYIANTYEEQEETILEWYDTDKYNSLVIIDQYNRMDVYKEMCGDLDVSVTWLDDVSVGEPDKKIIFINDKLDNIVKKFILEYGGIIGFFNG